MRIGNRLFAPGSRFSIARSLQALAVVVVLLILGATVHQLVTGRALIISDTERQMARLDMVFAEQTGRAVETVDFILRNVIENLQALRAKPPANPPADAAVYRQLLARRIAGVRQVSEVAVTDASGQVLYSSQPGAPHQLPPAVRALIAAQAAHPRPGLQFSEPFHGPDGQWTALMLRPILARDGHFEGAALAYLNLSYFEDFYRAVELPRAGRSCCTCATARCWRATRTTTRRSAPAMPTCRRSRTSWRMAWPAPSSWTARWTAPRGSWRSGR